MIGDNISSYKSTLSMVCGLRRWWNSLDHLLSPGTQCHASMRILGGHDCINVCDTFPLISIKSLTTLGHLVGTNIDQPTLASYCVVGLCLIHPLASVWVVFVAFWVDDLHLVSISPLSWLISHFWPSYILHSVVFLTTRWCPSSLAKSVPATPISLWFMEI